MEERDIFHFQCERGRDPEDAAYRLFQSEIWKKIFYYAPENGGCYIVTRRDEDKQRLLKEMSELGYRLANSY